MKRVFHDLEESLKKELKKMPISHSLKAFKKETLKKKKQGKTNVYSDTPDGKVKIPFWYNKKRKKIIKIKERKKKKSVGFIYTLFFFFIVIFLLIFFSILKFSLLSTRGSLNKPFFYTFSIFIMM